ncbi:hypothetical protein ACSS6W_008654 [Trichoderma asperelloides]
MLRDLCNMTQLIPEKLVGKFSDSPLGGGQLNFAFVRRISISSFDTVISHSGTVSASAVALRDALWLGGDSHCF